LISEESEELTLQLLRAELGKTAT